MLVPSIDLMDGDAVQLVGGKQLALNAGNPEPLASLYGMAGEIAVIDLDAALGQGSNEKTIEKLLRLAPCRVGGGVRSVEAAQKWLHAGAEKVILGTAACPDILRELPRERVIAALDAVDGEIVVEGWTTKTGRQILDQVVELRDYVGGFLVTFVEREGRLQGTAMDKVGAIVEAAASARVTIAGGITTAEEIATLDRLGADAQVGMALYTEKLSFADAFSAPLSSEREDGLWPTVVTDEQGIALGLVWSSKESLREALKQKRGVYHSRTRGVWVKGETSGATQELLRVGLDCDRDALRFTVRQHGSGFCHNNTRTCWGKDSGLSAMYQTLLSRKVSAPEGSYTKRLLDEPELLASKLQEEAQELGNAKTSSSVVAEAADVLYFTMATLAAKGVSLEAVESELDMRAKRMFRRPGDAKPATKTS